MLQSSAVVNIRTIAFGLSGKYLPFKMGIILVNRFLLRVQSADH